MTEDEARRKLPRPGDVVDRVEVIAEVARGGMAAVYAVRRTGIGGFDKVLAMKTMLPHLADEAQPVERFLDEARIASQISHPSVIHVLDVGTHEGLPYLIMEFLRGQPLSTTARKAKQSGRLLSLGFRLGVLARTAEGLAGAHHTSGSDGTPLGVVHRDVSPQNIHIGYDGTVKVVDFGIAAARGRIANTQSGEFRGKLAYASPEQIRRTGDLDARTDVWAMGVVAWELLAARRLFRGEDEPATLYNVLEMPVPELVSVAHDVPKDVSDWVGRCLCRDIEKRPADLEEFARVLDLAAVGAQAGRRADISKEMNELFREERAREDERLAAAQRGADDLPPIQKEQTGGSLTALSQQAEQKTGRPKLLVLGLLAAALLAGVVFAGTRLASRSSNAVEQATAPEPSATPQPPASAVVAPITLKVPEGVRMVLVNGKRRDDRPLRVLLVDSAPANVELVASDGRVVASTVTRSDDGTTLSLPEPAPAPSASVTPVPAKAPGTKRPAQPPKKGSGPLLADPY